MQLTEDQNESTYQIQSIQPGKIVINGKIYTESLIISPNTLTPWRPKDITSLTDADLLKLLLCKPDIILLGTGDKSVILPSERLALLLKKQFQVECMNTAAACRTFTILSAENRNVVAGLFL